MKFYCLCMSPALDALVNLPSAPKGAGEIYKNVVDAENAGGKAINVARWLAIRSRACSLVPPSAHSLPGPTQTSVLCGDSLDADAAGSRACSLVPPSAHSLSGPTQTSVLCGGLLGEDNAVLFERELAEYGIEDRFVRVAGPTRRNEMIAWPEGAFKVNRAAFPDVRPEDFPGLSAVRGLDELSAGDMVILSGSLPQNFPPSFYADCVKLLKERGFVVCLDASGKALELGVKAHPDLVKPNADECEPLVGFVPKTPDEFRRATDILRSDCAHVVISDGGTGAWFDGVFQAAPKVDVVDTTAAGDTLLAEWVWRWAGEAEGVGSLRECARWAVSAGSAACTMPGSLAPTVEAVERLKGTL